MNCPLCGHPFSKVTNTPGGKGKGPTRRGMVEGDFLRRRRECLGCGGRFGTIEMVDIDDRIEEKGRWNPKGGRRPKDPDGEWLKI